MKNLLGISCLVIPLLLLVGCGERKADTDNPQSYSKAGVAFEYPGNWTVTEDVQQPGLRYIFVETPGDALLVMQIYPTQDALEIQEFAENFAEMAREDTSIATFSASSFGAVKKSENHEMLTERFSVTVIGEKVPHTRTYMRKPSDGQVCFLIAQVSDEDLSTVTAGFDQVFASVGFETP